MNIPMTAQQAVELAEKARSIGPSLLLLVDDRHEALAHAQLAYSALVVLADQLREAESTLLQLLETNDGLRRALIGYINELAESDPPAESEGAVTVEFRTDTATGLANFGEIAAMLTQEISDTLG